MKRLATLLLAAASLVPVMAQNNAVEDYNKFKQQAQSDYADFRRQCNEQYAQFLRQAWQSYQAGPVIPRPKDQTVPPVVMPRDDRDKPVPPKPVPIDTTVAPVTPPEPEPQPKPVAPIHEVPQPVEHHVEFTCFGMAGKVRVPASMPAALAALNGDVSGEAIAAAWNALSDGDFDNMVRDCLEMRLRYDLCDWAYLQLTRQLGRAWCGSGNAAVMLSAWVYCQTGYGMKLGAQGGRLYMMAATRHTVYDMVGYDFDGINYYVIVDKGDTAPESLRICDAAFPGEQPMSLYLPKAQLFPLDLAPQRTITSTGYAQVQATVQVNKNLIDFYNTYPTSYVDGNVCTRWAMYALTPMAPNIVEHTYPQLRQAIAGKSQQEAANLLLNWVQTGLTYEYDEKVWGDDRAFFPEETLYYPYCDCEDRAILYTRLVRDLLGLKCMLIYYPGHLAAAVHFTSEVPGDWIQVGGERYTVTDPTYIGAPVGRTMPGMDNQTARVIVVE